MRAGLALLLVTTPAVAEPPITDRDYAIDFYEGAAVGDSRMVGMGGTGLALINGTAGLLLNASAPAVRLTTDNDRWTIDWHIDYLNGQLSSDFDNNGIAVDKQDSQLLTFGLGLRVGKWAGGFSTTLQTAQLDEGEMLKAQNARVRLSAARWFPSIDAAIGIGVQSIAFRILAGDPEEELFNITGGGLIAGATWLPEMENVRAGVELESPIVGGEVKTASCDPMACRVNNSQPYILPDEVEAPFRFGAGVAYRWAETAWNQQVRPKYRDERSVTAAADAWLTGPTKNGYGLEKFAEQELQRSGANVNFSARVGVEVEAIPGRLRLRAGTYYEPERFSGVGGRVHGTFGIEGRVFEFYAWGIRRGRIGIQTDIASRYRNIGLSIGLWH